MKVRDILTVIPRGTIVQVFQEPIARIDNSDEPVLRGYGEVSGLQSSGNNYLEYEVSVLKQNCGLFAVICKADKKQEDAVVLARYEGTSVPYAEKKGNSVQQDTPLKDYKRVLENFRMDLSYQYLLKHQEVLKNTQILYSRAYIPFSRVKAWCDADSRGEVLDCFSQIQYDDAEVNALNRAAETVSLYLMSQEAQRSA